MIVCASGGKSVGTAEDEFRFLYGYTEEEHGETVNADAEAAVRRAAVAEELGVEFNIFNKSLFGGVGTKLGIAALALITEHYIHIKRASKKTDV